MPVVATPVIAPLVLKKFNPAGKSGDIANVYGLVPPVAPIGVDGIFVLAPTINATELRFCTIEIGVEITDKLKVPVTT